MEQGREISVIVPEGGSANLKRSQELNIRLTLEK